MSNITIIPEKQTFRAAVLVDSGGETIKMAVKCSVNYERLTHKCTPIFTTIHEGDDYDFEAMEAKNQAVDHCLALLQKHREAHGLGRQGAFDFSSSDSDTDEQPLRAASN